MNHSIRYSFVAGLMALAAGALQGGEIAEAPEISTWAAPLYWKPPTAARMPGQIRAEAAAVVTPLAFVATTPCRQHDSRNSSALPDNTNRAVTLTGAPCGIPANAAAVSVNITVFSITGAGSNGVFRVGTADDPTFAWINFPSTETQRSNAGIVPLNGSGQIVVKVTQGAGSLHFVVDVNGYYDGNGVIMGVTPGTGMTGGGTSGVVSLGIAAGGVTSTELATNSVTPSKIAANAVTAGAIASGQVVKGINGVTDAVTMTGDGLVTVNTAGSTITVGGGGTPSGSFILGNPGDTTLIGAGYAEIAKNVQEFWTGMTTNEAPTGRYDHTAVWTGSKMIVWGGHGNLNTGAQYDPAANSWTATTTAGAPTGRHFHTAVWTGSKMIVWGGDGVMQYLNTGGQYDPAANSWTATTTTGAPTGRRRHTAVWTGSKMIVWGGFDGGRLNTGGRYDPAGNSWTATTTGGLTPRDGHTAVWTGSRMIVWGGNDGVTPYLATGGQYDPAGNSWTATTTTGVPTARIGHTAVWTGTKMIVWGGFDNVRPYLNTGGQYDPAGNSWTATTTTGAPTARDSHTAVWTGTKMIVWGGFDGTALNTGAQYYPAGNSWTATTTFEAPTGHSIHTAVWTGAKMIVWGGYDGMDDLNTGGQYSTLSLYVKN